MPPNMGLVLFGERAAAPFPDARTLI